MTKRLYYDDPLLTEFFATVTGFGDDLRKVYLDRTAFYPTSGGQPFDTGVLGGAAVLDVIDEEDRIAHVLDGPLGTGEVIGRVDWARRFDHMQQHTGQHVLSAVLEDLFQVSTLSFHLGQDASTIDVRATLSPGQILAAERRANDLVWENRAVRVVYEEAGQAEGLRKPSERGGMLRIIEIEGFDRSACGGTHVLHTGAIGAILIRKLDRVRGNTRIEFLCGARALGRARKDYDTLSAVARVFPASLDDAPALVSQLSERAQKADKERRKLAVELALLEGKRLYGQANPDPAGRRRHTLSQAPGLDDEIRALAQGFISGPKAVFLAISEASLSLLLACSADSGVAAGRLLKQTLDAVGGRGGGNAQLAQGSVPAKEALAGALRLLEEALG
jgi:alanyl-tRNA synthetase